MTTATVIAGFVRLQLVVHRANLLFSVFYGVVVPLLLLLVARYSFDGFSISSGHIIGILVLSGLLVTVRYAVFVIADEQINGTVSLIGTTQLSSATYMVARMLEIMILGALPLMTLAIALVICDVAPPRSASWIIAYAAAIYVFGMSALCISFLVAPATALLTANIVTVAAAAFCPLLYPLERVPELLQPLVVRLPPTLAADLIAKNWSAGEMTDLRSGLVLAAWAVALTVIAMRRVPQFLQRA